MDKRFSNIENIFYKLFIEYLINFYFKLLSKSGFFWKNFNLAFNKTFFKTSVLLAPHKININIKNKT